MGGVAERNLAVGDWVRTKNWEKSKKGLSRWSVPKRITKVPFRGVEAEPGPHTVLAIQHVPLLVRKAVQEGAVTRTRSPGFRLSVEGVPLTPWYSRVPVTLCGCSPAWGQRC
ncbi:hypothetical protein NDU88_004899 [Pleurodeles waltl]|uniref:Uncharacterized protein n=1 Tax=Pleurodeles waltl TaxID=8319 RepID=A0AAV7WZ67_PLEWA|nr:hypothetical protein NDU88_004899 [Pleurodeles waltl]